MAEAAGLAVEMEEGVAVPTAPVAAVVVGVAAPAGRAGRVEVAATGWGAAIPSRLFSPSAVMVDWVLDLGMSFVTDCESGDGLTGIEETMGGGGDWSTLPLLAGDMPTEPMGPAGGEAPSGRLCIEMDDTSSLSGEGSPELMGGAARFDVVDAADETLPYDLLP